MTIFILQNHGHSAEWPIDQIWRDRFHFGIAELFCEAAPFCTENQGIPQNGVKMCDISTMESVFPVSFRLVFKGVKIEIRVTQNFKSDWFGATNKLSHPAVKGQKLVASTL